MPVVAGGRAFFHVARSIGPNKEAHWLLIDGKLVGPEDWMGPFAVSPDGKHAAYWTWPCAFVGNGPQSPAWSHHLAVASLGKDGEWRVQRSDKHAECGILAPQFSADGERVFSCAVGSKGYYVLGLSGKRHVELSDGHPLIDAFALSESGNQVAYARSLGRSSDNIIPIKADHAELYFKGKRVGPKYIGVTQPTVDPRGEHVACVISVDGKRAVAIDGEKSPEGRFDHVVELAFDPTGKRLAFVANRGGKWDDNVVSGGTWFVVVRPVDAPLPLQEQASYDKVRDLVWDSAGGRLAYAARNEREWRVVCGDKKSEPHDYVGAPSFAADGKSLAFGTRDGRELWWRGLALE